MNTLSIPPSDHPLWMRLLVLCLLVAAGVVTIIGNETLRALSYLIIGLVTFAVVVDWVSGHEILRRAFARIRRRHVNLVDAIQSAIVTCDANGRICSANPAALRLFNKNEEALRNRVLLSLLTPRSHTIDRRANVTAYRSIERGVFEIHATNKATIWVRLRVIPETRDENEILYVLDDVTDNIHLSEHVADLAELDHMTGLNNRSYLVDQLLTLKPGGHEDRSPHLALIDLDHFKALNDSCGPHVGDLLIMKVAQTLRTNQRRGDVVARLGSDVFAVLLHDTAPQDARRKCEDLRKSIAAIKVETGTRAYATTASIGLCGIDQTTDNPVLLMTLAEVAMNLAKSRGRDRVHQFEGEDRTLLTSTANDLDWKQRLDLAMANNNLSLVLDPIVSSTTGVVLVYEALLRFHGQDGEVTRPSLFLPSAERFGLMREIDRWVITRAMSMLAMRREQEPGARFSINLSGTTLEDPDICGFIEQSLLDHDLPGRSLIFEITETIAITRLPAAVALLTRLKQLGCETALDDFGAGMSSFAYLRNLPVDYLKIDGQFIREVDRDATDQAMVRAMVELARAHDIHVIAEYVENKMIQDTLLTLGVNYLQGEFVTTGGVKMATPSVRAIGSN